MSIYAHLDQEQKGCKKGLRGTNNLLYIDRAVIKEVKSRNKNLAMAWIDYIRKLMIWFHIRRL